MKISVIAKPGAKHVGVKKIDVTHYAISVTESPREGKANKAVINSLAKHLDISKSRVKIISGHKSKQKVLGVL